MTEGTEGLLSEKEIRTASECMERALGMGADKVRISLGKSLMELFGTLNGELDKVSHCLDRSMSVGLFVDEKYGSFSTNRLEEEGIEPFLSKAI
jgi:PmbA protein